jgi:hypothetical protein
MARRSESIFAFLALLLLLSLTLLYGCRAFDPEPPIINRAPETYIVGAPAETTGTGFTRHMFWYGTDVDGEVVQFIYAITDSTVRDLDDPQNRDEEDDRFNPAEDVTTLETTDERFVGWTTKTDSIFKFTVDRGPTSSKDITFHIVAVDDRGAVDPTPARLYFFNNSLGNPRIVFRLITDVGTGAEPVWEERWTGDYLGVDDDSPEGSEIPFAGFERRFRIEWEASSPNGEIVGYRYRTEQGLGKFVPPLIQGKKQWDLDADGFEFSNAEPPSSELGANCLDDASGCDPARVRFPSGNYNLSVEALDVALVETDAGTGDLDFAVNYPPETQLVQDATYPRFEVRDPSGQLLRSSSVSSGDTVPANATVFFRSVGYDKYDFALPAGVPADSLCCDTPLDYDPTIPPTDPDFVPLVQYQSRLVTVRRAGDELVGRELSNTFSSPEQGDTLSFWVGPLDFAYESRTVDEHRRPDVSPEEFKFIGGFRPRVREDLTIPGGIVDPGTGDRADTLLVNLFGIPFPDNEIPFVVTPGIQQWWVPDPTADCGGILLPVVDGEPDPEGGVRQFGVLVAVSLRFVGEQDQRDPLSPVNAWSFAIFSDKDPDNEIEEGLESRDLSFFVDSPDQNEWEFGPGEQIVFWVPFELGQNPDPFHPTSTDEMRRSIGCLVAKRVGDMTVRLRGRTTKNTDEYQFYEGTRKVAGSSATTVLIGEFGRQSQRSELTCKFLIGGGGTGVPLFYWPDF